MKKYTPILLTLLMASISLSGCTKPAETGKIAREIIPLVEVSVFDVDKDSPTLSFEKSGTASSKTSVYVVPEASGRVVDVNVKIGDRVSKNSALVRLGDSLSTQVADIQANSANESYSLAKESASLSNESASQSVKASELGVKMAKEGYESALTTKENAEDSYESQKDEAEDGLDDIKDALNSAKDSLSDIEDNLEENPDNLSLKIKQAVLQSQISSLSAQKEQIKTSLDTMEESFDAQKDQMDTAIKLAKLQYESAKNQVQMAQTGADLQNIGNEMQVLQANSGAEIARLSADKKTITAPVNGVITELSAKKGNFISPGQVIAKIENPDKLSIKTSINEEERSFLDTGDSVKISFGNKKMDGEIISISPAVNEDSKKIDLEIEAENSEDLLPGTLVKIKFEFRPHNRIFVPLNSIYINEAGEFVKVISGNAVKFKQVVIGDILGDYTEILSGLKGNEKIIRTPDSYVEEGQRIKIAKN